MKIFLAILLFSFLTSCNNNNEETSEVERVDTLLYSSKSYHGFKKLSLFSNNEFKFINQVSYHLGYSKMTGSYTKKNNRLTLNPVLYLECKYINVDNTVKSVCDTIEFSKLDLKIKTKYFSFNWKNNNYLLSEESDAVLVIGEDKNDFNRFIDNYNNGYKEHKYRRYLVSKAKQVVNNKLPIDSFPENYRNLILKK